MSKIEKISNKMHDYLNLAKSEETPLSAKILLIAAVAYFLWPFDLIPDFIPIIGYLDDLIIVPLLIWLAFRQIEAKKQRQEAEKSQHITIEPQTPEHRKQD